jgi:hypothetical protein
MSPLTPCSKNVNIFLVHSNQQFIYKYTFNLSSVFIKQSNFCKAYDLVIKLTDMNE